MGRIFVVTAVVPNAEPEKYGGVRVDDESLAPAFDPETFETNVPNLFLAGGAVAGRNTGSIFIENGRFHGEKIIGVLAARLALALRQSVKNLGKQMAADMKLPLLDNIMWNCLAGPHAPFAIGEGAIRRYAPGFSPIVGCEDPRPSRYSDFAGSHSTILPSSCFRWTIVKSSR